MKVFANMIKLNFSKLKNRIFLLVQTEYISSNEVPFLWFTWSIQCCNEWFKNKKGFEKATEIISPPVVLGPKLSFTISHHSINSDLQYSSLKKELILLFSVSNI